jgi:hypothetical protein
MCVEIRLCRLIHVSPFMKFMRTHIHTRTHTYTGKLSKATLETKINANRYKESFEGYVCACACACVCGCVCVCACVGVCVCVCVGGCGCHEHTVVYIIALSTTLHYITHILHCNLYHTNTSSQTHRFPSLVQRREYMSLYKRTLYCKWLPDLDKRTCVHV